MLVEVPLDHVHSMTYYFFKVHTLIERLTSKLTGGNGAQLTRIQRPTGTRLSAMLGVVVFGPTQRQTPKYRS